MKNPKLYIAAMALMALAACQREDVGEIQHPDAVRLNVAIGKLTPTYTRVDPTDKNARSFAQADKIAISNSGEFLTYTLNGGKWQPEGSKFLKWSSSKMTFEAYYPISSGTSPTNFTLPSDQSTKLKLAASDYMSAAPKEYARPESGNGLGLSFTRRTSQVVVRIAAFSNEFVGTPRISDLRIVSAHGRYPLDQKYTEITPYVDGSDHTALVIPANQSQPIDDKFITLTVTDDRGSKSLSVRGIPVMQQGMRYTYNLTVGNGQITVDNVSVDNWGSEETILDMNAVLIKRINGVEFQFVYVKAGKAFQMGSPSEETERFDDELQHWVQLSKDYYISRTEITREQWLAVMSAGVTSPAAEARIPIGISWDDICTNPNNFLSTINSLNLGNFDLPTEAQWEYAARGGVKATSYMKYAGVHTDNTTTLSKYAWYKDHASAHLTNPTFVAGLAPNALGIYDMTGNVWEWCKDSWDESENYPTNTTQDNPVIDPLVSQGSQRVIRGGASMTQATNMRTAARFFYHPQANDNYTGFRLVLQVP